MFIVAQFIITKCWKQPKCPSVNEWIRKLWYIYTMKYYTAERKKESNNGQKLDLNKQRKNIKGIIEGKVKTFIFLVLNLSNSLLKNKYHMISLINGT